jgi:two-component system NtrC family sensor kinase
MKWSLRDISLQWKLNLFIYLGIFIFLLNLPMVYFEITNLNQRLLNLERAEDLYNAILEVRRYEKNFFLYHDRGSIQSTLSYVDEAQKLLDAIIPEFRKSSSRRDLVGLREALHEYNAFAKFKPTESDKFLTQAIEEKIRTAGKDAVDSAEAFLKAERKHVAAAEKNAMRWPLIFMGAMLLLFLAGARIVTSRVVRPLATIEKATGKIARGDFSPIPYDDKKQSQVDHLVAAFNRMAQELEAREEQVIHSRKIASLGTLVSGIAHELNNPINNIVLTADVLSGPRKVAREEREALIQDILNQGLRASDIVKNLLEFSRTETSAYKELDLSEVLRETIHIAENHIMLSKVKLRLQIPDELPPVNGNRQGLQQVFLNLITNAVQAMPDGGDLTIRAELEDGDKIKIDVRDNGTGIAKEHLPHIFDPFFTTKDVGQGTGLGLSVSFGIIKKHGGQISVKSKLGEGTSFSVILPVYEETRRS